MAQFAFMSGLIGFLLISGCSSSSLSGFDPVADPALQRVDPARTSQPDSESTALLGRNVLKYQGKSTITDSTHNDPHGVSWTLKAEWNSAWTVDKEGNKVLTFGDWEGPTIKVKNLTRTASAKCYMRKSRVALYPIKESKDRLEEGVAYRFVVAFAKVSDRVPANVLNDVKGELPSSPTYSNKTGTLVIDLLLTADSYWQYEVRASYEGHVGREFALEPSAHPAVSGRNLEWRSTGGGTSLPGDP